MEEQRKFFCVYCGRQIAEVSRFCIYCGKQVCNSACASTSNKSKVKPADDPQEAGIKPGCIVIGCILMFLQLLSFMGNAKTGNTINFSVTDGLSVFLYDLVGLLAYCSVGIFGLLLFLLGIAKDKARRGAIAIVICGIFFVIYLLF